MGEGTYCSTTRSLRAEGMGYATKSTEEIFTKRTIDNAMSPRGVHVRESRDSEEHPNSLPIIVGLDVTGSMGYIPHNLVKDGLPTMVTKIIERGEKDPQILFMGIGDHVCDNYPLQVSQFESSDELLDKWLTSVYLESGGGGNNGESYMLAWYFAAFHTVTDSFEKRNKKGFLFTIGDEPVLPDISNHSLGDIMGGVGEYPNLTSNGLYEKACEKYHVFHIHVAETLAGSFSETIEDWKQRLGENLIIAKDSNDIPNIIANKVIEFSDVQSYEGKTPEVEKTDLW